MRLLLTFAVVALAHGLFAQGADTAASADTVELSASHRAAAERLLEVMDTEQTLAKSLDASLSQQLEMMPPIEGVEEVMRDFFEKYMSFAELKDDYVQMYGEVYSEEELGKLIEFYQTPLGQRVASTVPELTARGMALGQSKVMAHMPELQAKLGELMSEGQEGRGAAPSIPDPTNSHN